MSPAGVPDDRLALEAAGAPARHLALRALHALADAERDELHRWLWELLRSPEVGGDAVVEDDAVVMDDVAILDVGAGAAAPWLALRGRIPPGWRIMLLDRSPDTVATARRALDDLGHPATGIVADAVALPFPDAAFDLVLMHHVLYHLPQRDRAIGQVRRVLRPGGRLVAATNGGGHLAEAMRLLGEVGRGWPALRVATPEPLAFTLENGAAQLGVSFADVARFVRPAVPVWVPADALVRYLLSLTYARDAAEAADLAAWVATLVAARFGGGMETSRTSGAFVARRDGAR